MRVTPRWDEKRADIIQADAPWAMQAIAGAPSARASRRARRWMPMCTPEPWDMPGYESQVIMAAGAFTMGASIELSADAPIREPFAAWMQGALTYPSGKVGLKLALQSMLEQGALRL